MPRGSFSPGDIRETFLVDCTEVSMGVQPMEAKGTAKYPPWQWIIPPK